MALNKRELFLKRRLRVRNKIKATSHGRLRLSVHRSSKNISVQLIDDVKGVTLAGGLSFLNRSAGELDHLFGEHDHGQGIARTRRSHHRRAAASR